jgi:hypothetical protein
VLEKVHQMGFAAAALTTTLRSAASRRRPAVRRSWAVVYFGVEISARMPETHVLGYGFEPGAQRGRAAGAHARADGAG